MKILITGIAGFIGFHLAKSLAKEGHTIIGIDSLNSYYDVSLKIARLKELGIQQTIFPLKEIHSEDLSIGFINVSLEDKSNLEKIFIKENFDVVVNLAAQAGVRYSIENPYAYIDSNIVGFLNLLENCRNYNISNFVFASSSSVYGLNESVPFSEDDNVDHPISLYAATKKSNELMAHTYSHLYNLSCTGLRFFTVYGPWGRPDMALFKFTKAIIEGQPIDIYNNGDMYRDFTYIDDVVNAISKTVKSKAQPNLIWDGATPQPATSKAPYRIYNVGNNKPIKLADFIALIEQKCGIKAVKNYMPLQDGDVYKTFADVSKLIKDFDYTPNTTIELGIGEFVVWYRNYYKV
jgi:UDP-glucuronate 4-epimerase